MNVLKNYVPVEHLCVSQGVRVPPEPLPALCDPLHGGLRGWVGGQKGEKCSGSAFVEIPSAAVKVLLKSGDGLRKRILIPSRNFFKIVLSDLSFGFTSFTP